MSTRGGRPWWPSGLPAAARFELIAAIDDYVSGNALHAVESLTRARAAEAAPGMAAAAVAYGIAQLQTGDFPQLSAIYAETAQTGEPAGPPTTEAALTSQFEHGLAGLLNGLAARMNITTRPKADHFRSRRPAGGARVLKGFSPFGEKSGIRATGAAPRPRAAAQLPVLGLASVL